MPDYLSGNTFTFVFGMTQIKLYAVWMNESAEVEWWQGQNYEQGSGADLILKIDYPLSNFASMSIDGTQVDETVYSLRSGSTIITINGSYADTLEEGGHMLQVAYRDNIVVDTGFTVTGKDSDDSDDGGGDDGDDSDYEPIDPSGEPGDINDDDENIDEYGIVVPNTGGNTEEGGDSGASMMIIVPALAATIYYIFRRFAIKKKSFGFEKHQN